MGWALVGVSRGTIYEYIKELARIRKIDDAVETN